MQNQLPEFIGPGKRFKIERVIGNGELATVFLATDTGLGRHVAIKALPNALALFGAQGERFWQEIRAVARFDHQNIVRLYDFGTDASFLYFVMQYVPGGSLQDRLDSGHPLAPSLAAHIVEQVAAALDYAHGFGVVHRDIKPLNILLRDDDWVYLADFGIALIEDERRHTKTGYFVGTPEYVSPEQVDRVSVDGRSDIYSLGLVLYQMVTGHLPFSAREGESGLSVALQRLKSKPPLIHQWVTNPPAGLQEVISTALSIDPEQRFQSGKAFSDALWRVVRDWERLEQRPTAPMPRPQPGRHWMTSKPAVIGASVALLAVCAATGVYGGGQPTIEPPASRSSEASQASPSVAAPTPTSTSSPSATAQPIPTATNTVTPPLASDEAATVVAGEVAPEPSFTSTPVRALPTPPPPRTNTPAPPTQTPIPSATKASLPPTPALNATNLFVPTNTPAPTPIPQSGGSDSTDRIR